MDFVALSSSRGTTFQAVLDSIANGSLKMQCLGLISDREDRGCVTKARAAGIPVQIVTRGRGEDRDLYDKKLDTAVRHFRAGHKIVIAALGWMYILSPRFVAQWKDAIINVHPSLLPLHPGAHAIAETLAAKEKESGMTIHFIDEGVDTGPILLQKTCPVLPDDTEDTLKARIQELEKEWYPKVLQKIYELETKPKS